LIIAKRQFKKHLGTNPHEKYDEKLKENQDEIKRILEAISFEDRVLELIDKIDNLDLDSI